MMYERVVRTAMLKTGLFLGLAWAVTSSADAAVVNAGNVTGLTVTTNGPSGNITASFALSGGGSVEVSVFAADVIRVNYHWAGPFDTAQPMIAKPFTNWPGVATTIADQGSKYVIQTSQLDVEVEKSPLKIHFKDKNGFYLLQDELTEYDAAYNYTGQRGTSSSKLKTRKVMPANQAYFGLGEYGGPMNRRGKEIDCWNTGTYNWGEFTNPTYMNIPFFYGVQPASGGNPAFVYGIFLNNPCRPLFKFGTEAGDKFSFQAGDGRMDYFFFGGGAGHSMPKVIDRYSELTGRPTFLPKWGLGYHLSRFSYDNQSWVEYIASEATAQDIPLDGVYLDIDYMDADADLDFADGQLRQLTLNSKFPNPAGMISYCGARGVKVVPLIEPWLQPGDPLHTEAESQFHFIKDNNSVTATRSIYVGNVSWFDYSSTPMNTWWQGKIVNWFNAVPFAGIWNDLTEPEGGDSLPHNGLMWVDGQFGTSNTDSRRFWSNERNYFGLRCARQSYNTMLAKDANKRPFVLSRSGNAGLQRYAVSWSGDTRANWFYHKATIRFGMGAMIAGAAWYGNDVGGFAGSVSPELMTRSTEANCLTPFFRNHCDRSSNNREPWRFSEEHKGYQRYLIKLRYRLMPYLYTLAYESTVTGEPMNVPPVFDYYADTQTHSQSDYDYLVGDYLLAAPVYNEGSTTRSVYLPYADGVDWYYWPNGNPSSQPSGDRYTGGQTVNVNAPMGTLPLFVRSGAIIPMSAAMQYMNQSQPGWMDIHCWPKGDSEFTLFEDDGETWDYLGGDQAKRRMVSSRTEARWDLTIEAKQGTYNPGARDFYVYCYNPGTSVVQSVTLNNVALTQVSDFNAQAQCWRLMPDGRIGVKVPDTGALTAIRVNWSAVNDTLSFASSGYSVSETSSVARVYVARSGDATGAVAVTYATAAGTAQAGADFTHANGTLNWAAGDTATKFFDIPVLDDNLYEGDESLSATLSAPVGASLGSPSSTTILILENDPVPPDLVITNPPTDINVAATTTAYQVQGLANMLKWAGLVWSNSLTGASGIIATGFSWTIPSIALAEGTNAITVTATNVGGSSAFDSGTNAVYADGWVDTDNGGTGWGPWQLYTSSADVNQNGRFMANNAAVDIGTPAWGLYANNGNLSEAKRVITNALTVGQTLSVRFDHGFINPGSGVGVAMQNELGSTLWEFFFNGGDTNYSISGGTTDIGWTSSGMDVAFTLSSPTTYVARITPYGGPTRTNTGALIESSDKVIRRFRAWNYNAGSGSDYDVFFNNLALSGGTGSGPSTSVVVHIIRASLIQSDIPQEWRDRHNLTGLNSGDYEDRDGDGSLNIEEYWADTIPTNPASFFGTTGIESAGIITGDVVRLYIQPSTNSRLYSVWYSTDLTTGAWQSMNINQPGAGNGGPLMLIVTNAGTSFHYRTGVKLP